MSGLTGQWGFGVENNPILDSPYVQQSDVGVINPPPLENDFLLLDGSNFLLLGGGNLELL